MEVVVVVVVVVVAVAPSHGLPCHANDPLSGQPAPRPRRTVDASSCESEAVARGVMLWGGAA